VVAGPKVERYAHGWMPTFVKRRWQANLEAFGGRKARQGFFYEAFVPDDIGNLDLTIAADLAEASDAAASAVRELGAHPPGGVSWEALGRHLLRAESVASSRIEGLEISHRRLARAAFGQAHEDLTAASVLGNVAAMEQAVALGSRREPMTSAGVRKIHRVLLHPTPDRHLAGKLRTGQGWIGGGSTPRDAAFIPPPEDEVPRLIDDLCVFASRDGVPAVIQAAIVHAQFETIHPFPDGNGRVGRCLIHAVLRRRGLASGFVPPVSLVLGANAKAYIRGLERYRLGHVVEWCGLFAAAVRTAAREVSRLGADVEALREKWRRSAGVPRVDSAAAKMIEALPGYPLLDVRTIERVAGVSNQAARLAVIELETARVIRRINTGKRNRAWEAVGLFELVEAGERRLRGRASG
jgi:Fic family protein